MTDAAVQLWYGNSSEHSFEPRLELNQNSLFDETHLLARCRWDTRFDDKQQAYQLQEDLSAWTRMVMLTLLEEGLQMYCAAGQTWRIDSLVLDLGQIPYEELATELPRRFSAALALQLAHLRPTTAWQESVNSLSTDTIVNSTQLQSPLLRLVGQSGSYDELLKTFLLSGLLPWWYRGRLGHKQILLHQLQAAPTQVALIVRQTGQAEFVRRRIVWQWGSNGIRRIIMVLEPYQHETVLTFADNLFQLQRQQQVPKSDSLQFQHHTWLWILTHLLVERGTLFNTMDFMQSTLRQMAQHYHLQYDWLLQQLAQTAQIMREKGGQMPVFIQALTALQQKALPLQSRPVNPLTQEQDFWPLLVNALQQNQTQVKWQDHYVSLRELFISLAAQQPSKMLTTLRHTGKEARVRKTLVHRLEQRELALVVRLLEPVEHLFILAHVEQTCEVLEQRQQEQYLVWEVVLAYLLVDGGTYFNRRELVYRTLLHISQRQQLSYLTLLSMLSDSNLMHQFQGGHRLELLTILHDLRQSVHAESQVHEDLDDIYVQALLAYFDKGSAVKMQAGLTLPAPEQLLLLLLKRRPALLKRHLGDRMKTLDSASPAVLSLASKLLALLPVASLERLLVLFQAEVADFTQGFGRQLRHWQGQTKRPGLMRLDMGYPLSQTLLASLLLGLPKTSTTAQVLTDFSQQLQQHTGLAIGDWYDELTHCLALERQKGQLSVVQQQLQDWLNRQQPVLSQQAQLPQQGLSTELLNRLDAVAAESSTEASFRRTPISDAHLASWSFTQKCALLAAWIQAGSGRESELLLLIQHIRKHSQQAQNGQHYRQDLLKTLTVTVSPVQSWQRLRSQLHLAPVRDLLTDFWPDAVQQQGQILTQWQAMLVQSGLWRGSAALLKQKLQQHFWQALLEQTLFGSSQFGNSQATSGKALDLSAFMASLIESSSQQLSINLGDSLTALTRYIASEETTNLQAASKRLWQQTVVRLQNEVSASAATKSAALVMSKSDTAGSDRATVAAKAMSLAQQVPIGEQMKVAEQVQSASLVKQIPKQDLVNRRATSSMASPNHSMWTPALIDLAAQLERASVRPLTQEQQFRLFYAHLRSAGATGQGSILNPRQWQQLLQTLIKQHARALLADIREQGDRRLLVQALWHNSNEHQRQHWFSLLWPGLAAKQPQMLNELQIWLTNYWPEHTGPLRQALPRLLWLCLLEQGFSGSLERISSTHLLLELLLAIGEHLSLPWHSLATNLMDLKAQQFLSSFISSSADWQQVMDQFPSTQDDGSPVEAHSVKTHSVAAHAVETPLFEVHSMRLDSEGRYLSHPLFPRLFGYLLQHGQWPTWMNQDNDLSLGQILADIQRLAPRRLPALLKGLAQDGKSLSRLMALLDLPQLLALIDASASVGKGVIDQWQQLHQWLLNMTLAEVTAEQITLVFTHQLLLAWVKGDATQQSPTVLLSNSLRALMQLFVLPYAQLQQDFEHRKLSLPRGWQQAFSLIGESTQSNEMAVRDEAIAGGFVFSKPSTADFKPEENRMQSPSPQAPVFPIRINNAGLVLVQGFIGPYFSKLGLTAEKGFVSAENQRAAVHYLQHLATGQMATEEPYLLLNKLLCGLAPTEPLEAGIEMTSEDIGISHSLLEALIDYWPAIGRCSLEGFRGNWLIRDGVLNETPESWELVVEKRPYDLLLQRAPFSYTVINYSWMDKPIYVTWEG